MPEGDTVWKTARVLHAALADRDLTGSDFRVPRLATVDLAGWRVVESASRGKHLLLRLAHPQGRRLTLHSHLRMDGSWRVYADGERWRGGPAHRIRAVLRTADSVAVGYHLHDLALVPTADENRLVGHLGPDLLGTDWDPDEAVRRLRQRPDRAIAEALLDQRNLAGVGNLYKSEVLFLRGISPWAPVADVDDLAGVVELARRMLDANRDRWAQVTTGTDRSGRGTYVFERAGAPCRRCGTLIRRAGQGDRITYWCPTCQPGATPAGTVRPTLARD